MCSGQATSAGKKKWAGLKKYLKVFPWTIKNTSLFDKVFENAKITWLVHSTLSRRKSYAIISKCAQPGHLIAIHGSWLHPANAFFF